MTFHISHKKIKIIAVLVAIIFICGLINVFFGPISDKSILYTCLRGTRDDVARSLNKYKWDVNTPLDVALPEDCPKELIFDCRDQHPGGSTVFMPIELAAINKDQNVLKFFLEQGAVVNTSSIQRALLKWMDHNAFTLLNNAQNSNISYDKLYYAAVTYFVNKKEISGNNKIILQILIDNGVFAKNPHKIFLDAASRVSCPDFYIILSENGIKFQDMATQLLEKSAVAGRLETTRLFLKNGGDPNTTVRIFRTTDGPNPKYIYMPLIVRAAMWNAGADVLTALLKAGADPNARDSDGMSALMRLDERISKARSRLEKLNTGTDTTRYMDRNGKLVQRGTPQWHEWVQDSKTSEKKWIKTLEERRAVLVNAGAKQ